MKNEVPEYRTEEFFPSDNVTFEELTTDLNIKEKQLIFKAYPEKGTDVFERALRVAECAPASLR